MSTMKVLNLVSAIMFTLFYLMMLVVGLMESDTDMLIGVIMLSAPVVVNWATFINIK